MNDGMNDSTIILSQAKTIVQLKEELAHCRSHLVSGKHNRTLNNAVMSWYSALTDKKLKLKKYRDVKSGVWAGSDRETDEYRDMLSACQYVCHAERRLIESIEDYIESLNTKPDKVIAPQRDYADALETEGRG